MKARLSAEEHRERRVLKTKIVAAAALVVIFAAVVFSVPEEKLAWQGAYVMGTLLLPTPSARPYVRTDAMRENADASFSLLAFASVAGIVGLVARRMQGRVRGQKGNRSGP